MLKSIWDSAPNDGATTDQHDAFIHLVNGEIAAELGWKFDYKKNVWTRADLVFTEVPSYMTDLNLCQDFYDDFRENEEHMYTALLSKIIFGEDLVDGIPFNPISMVFASAHERCLAFCVLREL
jgi:hypothetical protein